MTYHMDMLNPIMGLAVLALLIAVCTAYIWEWVKVILREILE